MVTRSKFSGSEHVNGFGKLVLINGSEIETGSSNFELTLEIMPNNFF